MIHQSITATHWKHLLLLKDYIGLNVLQFAAYADAESYIETIEGSVTIDVWLQLLLTPLPKNISLYQKEYYQQAVKLMEIRRVEAKIQKALLTNDVKGKRKVLIVAVLAFLSFVQNQQQQKEKERIKIIKFEQAVTIHIWPNLDECRNEMLLNIPVSMSCRIMKLAGMERMYVII